jgi:hypothetical protein
MKIFFTILIFALLSAFCVQAADKSKKPINVIIQKDSAPRTTRVSKKSFLIPQSEDWSDEIVIFRVGADGEWDSRFTGMMQCGATEFNGKFLIYYIAANGKRKSDRGPKHRALGVATLNESSGKWEKYSDNPILTYWPTGGPGKQDIGNEEEEGIFSCGVEVAGNKIVILYGAMNAHGSNDSVYGNARYAVSSDGYNFVDQHWGANEFKNSNAVLNSQDSNVWGYGDEIFPCGIYANEDGKWYASYVAKGINAKWDLGQAWGQNYDNMPNTNRLHKYNKTKEIRGCSYFYLSPVDVGFVAIRKRRRFGINWSGKELWFYRLRKDQLPLSEDYIFNNPPDAKMVAASFAGGSIYFSPSRAKAYQFYVNFHDGSEFLMRTADLQESK